jgi:hypothetical protein
VFRVWVLVAFGVSGWLLAFNFQLLASDSWLLASGLYLPSLLTPLSSLLSSLIPHPSSFNRRSIDGQQHVKCGAFAEFAFDGDGATAAEEDLLDDGEA